MAEADLQTKTQAGEDVVDITAEQILADFLERHKRPDPVGPGEILTEDFARSAGYSRKGGENKLWELVEKGKVTRRKAVNPATGRLVWAYRPVSVNSTENN